MSTDHFVPPRPTQPFQYPPQQLSSRSSYPIFLSFHESFFLQLSWAFRGLCDSFRWDVVLTAVSSDSEIRANVYKSLLLNSVSLLSIYVFDLILHPLLKTQDKNIHRNIGWFYKVLWLFPIVGMSLYLNGTWCTIIAKRSFLLQHGGRPVATQPTTYTSMLRSIATSAYRAVMVVTSILVSFTLSWIPLVGPIAGFIFFCWIDAYYCFEFVWIAKGLSLASRIRFLEERWAYYLAFGLPAAALCTWGSSLANAALFALVFPMYIMMAMKARPVPNDPYNPIPPLSPSNSSSTSPHPGENRNEVVVRHPSPFIPIRIPIFSLVILLNDAVVKVLNFIGGRPIVRHKATFSKAYGAAESDNAEDGNGGVNMKFNSSAKEGSGRPAIMRNNTAPLAVPSIIPNPGLSRPSSERFKIGARRKMD